MSDKFQNRYRIASAQLQNWNYGSNAAYFVTICTLDREFYFGNVVDGKMVLSNLGIIADVMWHEIINHAKNVELGPFIVMPNHVHGILILCGNELDASGESGQMGTMPIDTSNDDTTHVISPNGGATTDDGTTVGVTNVGTTTGEISNVETRHALSLQSPQPPSPSLPPTIGQQRFQNQGKNTLSSIVGSYKSAVSKHAHRLGFEFQWQSRYYDHIIRNDESFQRISDYIRNNPSKWTDDKFFNDVP